MKKKTSYLLFILTIMFVKNLSAQVGINTTTPLSTLDINGNLSVKEIGVLNTNVSGSGVFVGGTNASPKVID